MGLLRKAPERKVCRYKAIENGLFYQKIAHKCNMDIENLSHHVTFNGSKSDDFREQFKANY